jgi:hypothetical protein
LARTYTRKLKLSLKICIAAFLLLITFERNCFSGGIDSGLVAFYPFSGNANDESGNGNHGVNHGAVLTTDRFGLANSAYQFSSSYIEAANSASLQSPRTSMTIAFWINISQWDQSSAGFFAKSNTASYGQYGSIANNDPYIQFDIGGQYVRMPRYFALNTWYFICYRWDGQEVKFYLNELLYDSANFSGTVAADNSPLILGKHTPGSVRYLNGKLDDVRIYNRALTEAEILRLYNEGNLDVRLTPQGFYNPVLQRANMRDSVRIYLREPYAPFGIVDSAKGLIDSVSLHGNFRTRVQPGLYYLVVKHRNSIETWSSAPVYIEAVAKTYDFTLFASQAYGNNLVLNGNNYCIFSGDVNQDGIVDATDNSLIDNDAYYFREGYINTDLTGDRAVDGSDYTIAENNAASFVSAITPMTYQSPCNITCSRFITWSGYTWCVATSNGTRCYPGPNYYSASSENVFIDTAGDLHIKITKSGGRFYCSAIFTTQTVGYGKYTFLVSSRVNNIDRNAVVGLFTWNDKSCVTNANSELDIEFTRWGDANDPNVINYSVQPTNFGQETERYTTGPMAYTGNKTQHIINWTPSLVSFSSYKNHVNPPVPADLIYSWSFGSSNPPKSKEECNSLPIVIPAPETGTHLNINLWLDRGRYPTDNQEVELILHQVTYTPL